MIFHFNVGITMAIGGILSGFCFACIGPLAKIFDERVLLLVGGIVPMILGPDHPESLSTNLKSKIFCPNPKVCDPLKQNV